MIRTDTTATANELRDILSCGDNADKVLFEPIIRVFDGEWWQEGQDCWRFQEYEDGEGPFMWTVPCEEPLKILADNDWLRRKIESDPDLPCEVGDVER